ncbi:TIGR04283 family arsenosugar biosynthesis glycosyltransferase [Maridesulfovibrio salexigens]|uniref:Glycosyl transferase family 2 n=1 Tax=Maridesulfovibrio salexigens (strain ATCC 14822 / DSM 2638 / NCIMB 8403 / VKM B-1763) TaxID=526222 RepID=C6C0K1_MARSD|nr:TIGR04283 family arsenosugar biosynthesis glycosyltransferase [Maridesulfovibrio salexigens]ACS79135.1 glycosyl transferase family 2 [Maridesulfovibrio salexigens DSM 2638]
MPSSLKISVIIPVYNEADTIHSCIANVNKSCGDNSEIIIVDGSADGSTLSAINDDKVMLLASPPGRAVQMNYGAQKAKGEILIFLHADTVLPHAAGSLVRKALRAPCAAAGAFKLGFDTPSRTMKFIAFLADLRCRIERVPYGDQAVFISKSTFDELGGFPEIPLMEDVELFQTIKRKRLEIVILKESITTSARRYLSTGPIRCALRNTFLRLLHRLGVRTETLAAMYCRKES